MATTNTSHIIPGSMQTALAGAVSLGPVDPDQSMEITVRLRAAPELLPWPWGQMCECSEAISDHAAHLAWESGAPERVRLFETRARHGRARKSRTRAICADAS